MNRSQRGSCEAIREVLAEHVLAPDSRELPVDVHDHLRECSPCRAEHTEMQVAAAALPADMAAGPPNAVRRRVHAYARDATGGWGRHVRRRLPRWWKLAVVGPAVAIAALVTAILHTPVAPPPAGESAPVAPMFEAIDVATGVPRSFDEFQGRVVLLNFWATWCGPCESELASMERLYRRYRDDGFVVLAVSVDRESRHKVRQWVEERGLTFPVLQDARGDVERLYRTVGVPESFVVNAAGEVAFWVAGPRAWDDTEHAATIKRILEAGGRDRS